MADEHEERREAQAEPAAEGVAGPKHSRTRRWSVRTMKIVAAVVGSWFLAAYLIAPFFWTHYEHAPAMVAAPRTTVTAQGIPGDPLNVGLIGTKEELIRAMAGAGWDPADPVTLRTSLEIAGSVIRGKPYPDAPVSPLFVFGRKQDLAFEKPAGASAKRRHHVRFWESTDLGRAGEPLWIGAVTFDRSVGLSHRTGQITHHIAPDVDDERDALMAGLREHGLLSQVFQVTGVGATLFGRNGGGDPYYTDGELTVGVLADVGRKDESPATLDNPPVIRFKEQLWSVVKPMLDSLPGSQADDQDGGDAP
ncbi:LssY C-terminal domain-containing protein [Paludisphaera soli]|uniref:LssY C-terminal domain-containing protein n=1 Tax=Paludisphaera soli TaxID=2712865 RepID=UPI0013E9DE03|nr:LssY C-terminal domain-containing protein [Paludisphaera soli]